MMRRFCINFSALVVGLLLGAVITLANADPVPCDCAKPVDRQPNGLPK